MALEEIRKDRLAKLGRYEANGQDPYPPESRRSFFIGDLRKRFTRALLLRKPVMIVGRIRALREHGGVAFFDLEDSSGRIQLLMSRDDLKSAFDRAFDTLDIGDFIEVKGKPFKTKRGEPTVRVSEWRMLAKSLLPLPEKWHGLQDVEERFRKRYLDLLMNPEVRTRFEMRAKILRALRMFLEGEGFMEVETPILQHKAGGALARPFITHHEALGIDLVLRIAPELYLKELLVGGFERVYEIGRVFRNEGIDATHSPEFTSAEWYAAYWDEDDMMACVERMLRALVAAIGGENKVIFDGKEIDFKKRFSRVSFLDVLARHAQVVSYEHETRDSLAARARQFGIDPVAGETKGKIADDIFKKVCRPHLVNPTFVTSHPIEISPLAKRTAKDASTVRRFQLIVGGLEIVNAFSELNDPRDQRFRFEEQAKARAGGDVETHPMDEDYIEALEYGMPPAAGAGLGIDRLVMLLTDTKNLREVQLFPTMRPRF